MASDLVEAWDMNNRKNFLLLDGIPAKSFGDQYSPTTRTVASQFAHLHNVRVYHLKNRGPHLLGDLKPYPRGAQPTKREVRAALEASEKAIARLLAEADESGRVKSWKGSPTTYLSYFIAHEAHHRGLILVCLRFGGTKVPKSVKDGLWYWRKKKDEK